MALAIDPDKVGMPSIDDWADSVFGPSHYDVGPGDPQLGLPDYDYNDGFDPPDGLLFPLLPAYGLDALEVADGPVALALPMQGLDGVDDVGWTEVLAPAAFARDILVDVAPLLAANDLFVDESDEAYELLATAPAFGVDDVEREDTLLALGTAPAFGQDLLAEQVDEDELLLPLPQGGMQDGVDGPDDYAAVFAP